MEPSNSRIAPVDITLLIIRVTVGGLLAVHGYQKLFGGGMEQFVAGLTQMGVPMPQVSAYLAGISEFAGGALVAIGVLSRLAAVPAAFTMGVAFFVGHGGVIFGPKGGELALVYGLTLIALIICGPGRLALISLIKGPAASRSLLA